MFDSNLLFSNAQAVTTNANGTSKNVKKTAEQGVWVEIAVTAFSGTSLDVVLKESNDDSTYNDLVTFAQITGTGRWARKVHTKKAYLRPTYTISGTSATVTAGIVSGAPIDQVS